MHHGKQLFKWYSMHNIKIQVTVYITDRKEKRKNEIFY